MLPNKTTRLVIILITTLFLSYSGFLAESSPRDNEAKTVVQMRQLMNGSGYWCGPAEGILGSSAYQSVVELQLDNHLLTDGLIGNRTRQAPHLALIDAIGSQQPFVADTSTKVGSSVAAATTVPSNGQNPVKVAQNAAVPTPSRGASTTGKRVITMVATGYDGCYECNKPYYGYPSYIGLPLARGIVAVDPDVIPMGTRLLVEGYGQAIAADQGNAIQGNRIDLFFDSHQEALNFGKKTVQVTILGK